MLIYWLALRLRNQPPIFMKKDELKYSGGSNTKHVWISNGPKAVWLVNGLITKWLGLFWPHLAVLCTGSDFEWSVLVHSCGYSPKHSETELFQYQFLKLSDFEWILNLNVRYSSPHSRWKVTCTSPASSIFSTFLAAFFFFLFGEVFRLDLKLPFRGTFTIQDGGTIT